MVLFKITESQGKKGKNPVTDEVERVQAVQDYSKSTISDGINHKADF